MNDTMNDNKDRGDDRITRPPANAVHVKTIESWDILFSEAEKNLYFVPTDYHPEPFRISLRDLRALHASLSPTHIKKTATKPAKNKMRRHQKRKQDRRG